MCLRMLGASVLLLAIVACDGGSSGGGVLQDSSVFDGGYTFASRIDVDTCDDTVAGGSDEIVGEMLLEQTEDGKYLLSVPGSCPWGELRRFGNSLMMSSEASFDCDGRASHNQAALNLSLVASPNAPDSVFGVLKIRFEQVAAPCEPRSDLPCERTVQITATRCADCRPSCVSIPDSGFWSAMAPSNKGLQLPVTPLAVACVAPAGDAQR